MQPEKRRVLYVDSDRRNAFAIAVLLRQENYEATTAHSTGVALRLARNEHFDLFILDKPLCGGASLALCREIHDFNPSTPVIFFSADAHENARQEVLCAGAEAYVVKPDINELVETANRLLAHRGVAARRCR